MKGAEPSAVTERVNDSPGDSVAVSAETQDAPKKERHKDRRTTKDFFRNKREFFSKYILVFVRDADNEFKSEFGCFKDVTRVSQHTDRPSQIAV